MPAVSEMIVRWRKSISSLEKIVADHGSGRAALEPQRAKAAKHALERLKAIIASIEKEQNAKRS